MMRGLQLLLVLPLWCIAIGTASCENTLACRVGDVPPECSFSRDDPDCCHQELSNRCCAELAGEQVCGDDGSWTCPTGELSADQCEGFGDTCTRE